MINKISTRFKVYEGVIIGEIQAATDGDLSSWAWISGEDNTADWLTRGRIPDQLGEDSHWSNGPPILYKSIEEWGLKFGMQLLKLIPTVKVGESFQYLGRYFNFNMSDDIHKSEIISLVGDLMSSIDSKPLHPKNKLLLYSRYVLSKLSWDFTISNIYLKRG